MSISLHTLPVEIIFRVFDHLSDRHLFLSTSNICLRLNAIQNSYHRFQVSTQYYQFPSFHPQHLPSHQLSFIYLLPPEIQYDKNILKLTTFVNRLLQNSIFVIASFDLEMLPILPKHYNRIK